VAPAGAGPTGWAHQAAGFQSNGAVTVKSLSGGSHAGTQNPSGAVAKANQNAVTQAPTVIIQATSGGYPQALPLLVSGTSSVPPCPTGYSSVWTISSSTYPSCTVPATYNVAGTRFSFGFISGGGGYPVGWFTDNSPTSSNGTLSTSPWGSTNQNMTVQCYSGGFQQWAAALCTK